MSEDRIIFVHIPKAAGQTFISVLRRQYRRGLATYKGPLTAGKVDFDRDVASAQVVAGHFPYGLHTSLPGTWCYATFLREPVSRVISLYRFVKSNPSHHLHDVVASMDLLTFVSSDLDEQEVENGQTRQLSGEMSGTPDRDTLALAKDHVEQLAIVGLVECFDESVMMMKKRFGWSMPYYMPHNAGSFPATTAETVTDEDLDAIRERNLLDIELYRAARQRFERQRKVLGPLFAARVASFRSLNAAAGIYRRHIRRKR